MTTHSIKSPDDAKHHPEKVQNILVCQLRQIGDVLLATPALELLAAKFPTAKIHVFTESKCTPMLLHNPHVHKVWDFNKKELGSLVHQIPFYWNVARQNYDILIDFQQLPRCRWIATFSNASIKLSYLPPWYTRPLYTHFTHPQEGYAAQTKASILAPLGLAWHGQKPRLYLTAEEIAEARILLHEAGLHEHHTLITLDPTHRRSSRCWPIEHYAELISLAAEADHSLRFLPLYGPGEKDTINTLQRLCRYPDRIVLPDTMLSLRQMAACIAAASVHVGNCSAPRHIAVAVSTPSFTILGSTGGVWTFPSPEHTHIALNKDCQPCEKNICPRYPTPRCLEELLPSIVLPRLLEHLTQHSKQSL